MARVIDCAHARPKPRATADCVTFGSKHGAVNTARFRRITSATHFDVRLERDKVLHAAAAAAAVFAAVGVVARPRRHLTMTMAKIRIRHDDDDRTMKEREFGPT